jgi:hypothetical protein
MVDRSFTTVPDPQEALIDDGQASPRPAMASSTGFYAMFSFATQNSNTF